jgi:sugar lactone lactonase YvrE
MPGILVAQTFELSRLRDVNDAAKADQYGLVWDSGTSKHIYVDIVVPADLSSYLSTADIDTLAELNAIVGDDTIIGAAATDASSFGFVVDEDNMASDLATKIPTQQSVKAYVDSAVAGLYDHKGGYDASTNTPDLDTAPSGILKGDAYTVSVAGNFFAVAVEAGDVLIADQDNPVDAGDWTIVNRNIDSSAFATTSHTHAASDVTSGTFDDARISESSVTQHEAALTITESQISDLQTYLTGITAEPLSDLSDVTITSIASGELLKWNGSAWINNTLAEAGIAASTHTHAASDVTSGTLAHERGGLEFDASTVAIGDVIAGTGAGTMGLVTSSGHSDGDVLTIQADGTVDWENPAGGGVTDHGALTGLSDDDHTQYLLGDGTRVGTGIQELKGLNLTDATELTISTGAITVTQGYHTVDTEGDASTDDLDTITAAKGQGDIIILRPVHAARSIVVKHGTGNILCIGGCDITLDDVHDCCQLVNIDGTNWAATPHGSLLYCEDSTLGTMAGDMIFANIPGQPVTNLHLDKPNDRLENRGGVPTWQPRSEVCLSRCVATGNVGLGWDISTGSYASKSMSVGSQETATNGVAFSADGTKAYVLGNANNTIYQYTLSTAWDISTGSYASKSMSVGSQETAPTDLAFSSDGTQCYIIGTTFSDSVYQYTLSTPWDISTGSYASKSMSVQSQEYNSHGVAFSGDGTKCYIIGYTNNTIYQYALSTAWDISTGSYASKSMSAAAQDSSCLSVRMSADGTKAYVLGNVNDTIYQYTLSTPWDISTGSYASKSMSAAAQESTCNGLAFAADGSIVYVIGNTNKTIYQYTLNNSDPSPIDGQTLATNDRVLLSAQTNAIENGVYLAVDETNPSTWTRVADMATGGAASGRTVAVTSGSAYGTSLWICETAAGSDVVGSNSLTFTQYV